MVKRSKSLRPGLPRFDQIDRRLHCFYEPLVLLRILEPTRGSRKHEMPLESSDESFKIRCHRFLDNLSWLCDYRTGGRTVSSIALEETPQGPIYWLAANQSPNKKVRDHLERILQQLESLASSPEKASVVQLAIRRQSIQFSREKVKYYVCQLGKAVEHAKSRMNNHMSAKGGIAATFEVAGKITNKSTESLLFEQLDSFQELKDDHDLVARASEFRHSSSDQLLNQMTAGTADWCHWHLIRHYVGRLRSWPRSAELLVQVARKHPPLVSGFSCEIVPTPSPMRIPSPDGKTNLDSILRRTVGKSETERLQKLQNILKSMRHFDIEASFKGQYADKSLNPRIHSELLMLEHFYVDRRNFVNNDRYIGCSKPSCYCCDMYIRYHPGGFESRACHGNLWTNWALPVDIRSGPASSMHAKKILEDMIEQVRRDLLYQIESKQPQRRKWPDSTTGMSGSILVSNSIRTDLLENLVSPHLSRDYTS
jgi:OTT_1508-like deaminase